MNRQVERWEVPVDDQWHEIEFYGSTVLHVAARTFRVVEFWTSPDVAASRTYGGTGKVLEEKFYQTGDRTHREFRVFGTGQEVDGLYHGTAVVGTLVWHLFSRLPQEAS